MYILRNHRIFNQKMTSKCIHLIFVLVTLAICKANLIDHFKRAFDGYADEEVNVDVRQVTTQSSSTVRKCPIGATCPPSPVICTFDNATTACSTDSFCCVDRSTLVSCCLGNARPTIPETDTPTTPAPTTQPSSTVRKCPIGAACPPSPVICTVDNATTACVSKTFCCVDRSTLVSCCIDDTRPTSPITDTPTTPSSTTTTPVPTTTTSATSITTTTPIPTTTTPIPTTTTPSLPETTLSTTISTVKCGK